MNTRRSCGIRSAAIESSRAALAARRTIPGPASTRYDELPTMIATAGPDRSGSAFGVPVPSTTTRVAGGGEGIVEETPMTPAARADHIPAKRITPLRSRGRVPLARRAAAIDNYSTTSADDL